MENALLYFDGQRYRWLAWCVLPNHVHVFMGERRRLAGKRLASGRRYSKLEIVHGKSH
jgi:putative DNA methylase